MEQPDLLSVDFRAGVPVDCEVTRCTASALPLPLPLPSVSSGGPKVAILLCTYYGQRYLAEQLESFAAQTHDNWEVWASDDGSEDDTHAILGAYRRAWGANRLNVHFGPSNGFSANFLSLIHNDAIVADYYAYSDQDDIWEVDKLERGVRWLGSVPADVPALYCTRTRLVDAANNEIGISPLFSKKPSFANALIQSIAGGNTMVLNNAARALLREAGCDISVVTHDWWTYLVVAGCGGQVYYDCKPSLRYRQHDDNLVGANNSWAGRFMRVRLLLEGRFAFWNDSNILALTKVEHRLTPENKKTLDKFVGARSGGLFARLAGIKRSGVYRQTFFGNLGLVVAAFLGKI